MLCNAMLLAEGWNSPRATICMHLAPTASKRIYQQRVGRVTRRHPGKEAGLVIDFVHPATRHDESIVTLHSLLDRDVYRGGAIVVGPVRRGRGRRVRVEKRVIPVSADPERRLQVLERELWRTAVERLDYSEQHVWAALAGARVQPNSWRKAKAMLQHDQAKELRRRFLLTCIQRNRSGQLKLKALAELAATREAEPFDEAIDMVGTWQRDQRRAGVRVLLQALAEKRIGRRDQAQAWVWRLAEFTRECHEEYAVARWPETKRLLGLFVNSSGRAHGKNARRLVQAARGQDRRLAVALLAAAVAHTPEAEEVLRGARMRMARKPSAVARELLRNLPKGGKKRRRRSSSSKRRSDENGNGKDEKARRRTKRARRTSSKRRARRRGPRRGRETTRARTTMKTTGPTPGARTSRTARARTKRRRREVGGRRRTRGRTRLRSWVVGRHGPRGQDRSPPYSSRRWTSPEPSASVSPRLAADDQIALVVDAVGEAATVEGLAPSGPPSQEIGRPASASRSRKASRIRSSGASTQRPRRLSSAFRSRCGVTSCPSDTAGQRSSSGNSSSAIARLTPTPITAHSGGRASISTPPSLCSSSQMSFGHLIAQRTGASSSQASATATGTASGSSRWRSVRGRRIAEYSSAASGGATQRRPPRPRPAVWLDAVTTVPDSAPSSASSRARSFVESISSKW